MRDKDVIKYLFTYCELRRRDIRDWRAKISGCMLFRRTEVF